MIVRLAKDYKHYEILYESQEEAQAVKDYLDQILTSGVVEKAELQVAGEEGEVPNPSLRNG